MSDKKLEVNGTKYQLREWNLDQRSEVMDKLLLDNQKSKNGMPFVSFSTCVLAIQMGTSLTDSQINELPTDDLVLLGGKVMDRNDKKKAKKRK